ncbi:MAG: hypothetical protein ACR2MQ_15755 [Gemmatimonadaceae bacterium]
MNTTIHTHASRGPRARMQARLLAPTLILLALAGCKLLDVTNPNNVPASALDNPSAAAAEVSGVVAALARGLEQVQGDIETASDNIKWIGSLDGMSQLNVGNVRNPYNEFIENSFFGMAPARFMANQTVQKLTGFASKNTLKDANQLALANLYDAITYDQIANYWDDFVIASDGATGGPNVGPDKMIVLYDSADAALARAQPIAASSGDNITIGQIYAWQARSKFDREIWKKLNPSGQVDPSNALVNSPEAAALAQKALTAWGSTDYRMQLQLPSTALTFGNCSFAGCANSRQEITFAPQVATYNYKTKALTVALKDPITNSPDPVIAAYATEFATGGASGSPSLSPLTITGARDMLLIIAENALANSDMTGFTTAINKIRAFNNLTPYSGQLDARVLLIYERRVNTFLQARRLTDLYRFGINSPFWSAASDASTCPGSFFPITATERSTNANVTLPPACHQ